MNANQFALRIHADGPKVRKFLRDVHPVDKTGGRWNIPDSPPALKQLRRRYRKWAAVHTRAGA